MKLTIGIPIYNNSKDLIACLESINENVSLDIELILVDDKSAEDIREIAVKFANTMHAHIKSFIYIRNKENKGFPHNVNIILDQATSDIMCILNSDTYVCKNAMERVVDAMQKFPNAMIAGPTTSSANGNQQIYEYSKETRIPKEQIVAIAKDVEHRFHEDYLELSQRETNNQIQGFCYFLKKQAIEKIGYFDEIYGVGTYEESDYNSRADFLGYKALWVKKAYVHHYLHGSFRKLKRFSYIRNMFTNDAIWLNKAKHLTLENAKEVKRTESDFVKEILI